MLIAYQTGGGVGGHCAPPNFADVSNLAKIQANLGNISGQNFGKILVEFCQRLRQGRFFSSLVEIFCLVGAHKREILQVNTV